MTLPWYPRDMGKYARDTKHLSMLEHGAYNLMLDYYYSTGGLPQAVSNASLMPDHSRIYRLCGAMNKAEQDAVDSVLKLFFRLDNDGYYRQDKCEEIIQTQELKHQRRVEAGRMGGAKKASSNAKAMPKHKERDKDISLSKDSESPAGGLPSTFLMPDGQFLSFEMLFERMWKLYPALRDKGHKGRAMEQFKTTLKNGVDYETLCRSVARYRKYCDGTGELNPDFFRWLRDRGYEKEYAIPAAQKAGAGRSAGYSLETAADTALRDQTRRPEGRADRAKSLGLDDDSGNV